MKKNIIRAMILILTILTIGITKAYAGDTDIYTVQNGDSLWRIAVKYQVGLSEIVNYNKQFKDPALIYPGDKVTIPLYTAAKGIEQQVVDLVNKERTSRGLATLQLDWQVSRVARYKSDDMINKKYFSHTSPTYGSPFDMLTQFNIAYKTAGENIAKGQKTASAVVTSWMNSEGHRKNILSSGFTHIGVGYATDSSDTPYWTQMFIKP